MEKGQNDRRVRKTRALLRGALTTLLGEKDVKDITVSELTALADVNRGTFYCHYKDIYDIVEQVENELFEGFSTLLGAYSVNTLRHGLRPILRDVFAFIGDNLALCSALLNLERDTSFLERLKAMVQEKVVAEWRGLYQFMSTEQYSYYLAFVVGGAVGLVQHWITEERRKTPEEMADLAERLIGGGVGPLGE